MALHKALERYLLDARGLWLGHALEVKKMMSFSEKCMVCIDIASLDLRIKGPQPLE